MKDSRGLRVLVCDDEKDIVSALRIYLSGEGYEVLTAENGKMAVETARNEAPQLILLDIMMPEMDGVEAMVEIRKFSNAPVILLTAKSEDTDKILGLNLGADDYITKPFNPVEVTARVRAALRRYTVLGGDIREDSVLRVGALELDDDAKEVRVDGELRNLTRTEYEILKLLMSEPGKVFSSRMIYNLVWEDDPFGAENTVAVHVRHLREKIEIDPASPRYIKVVWGQGYKIEGTALG